MKISKALINQRFIQIVNDYLLTENSDNKTKIAEKIKIKPAKFSEILNERMNAGIEEILLFCDFYNYNLNYVLKGEGVMKIEKSDMAFEEPTEKYMSELDFAKEKNEFYLEKIELLQQKLEQCEQEKKSLQGVK